MFGLLPVGVENIYVRREKGVVEVVWVVEVVEVIQIFWAEALFQPEACRLLHLLLFSLMSTLLLFHMSCVWLFSNPCFLNS